MSATTRSPRFRPPDDAEYYYLGRPATWWLTAMRQPHLSPGMEAGQ